MIARHVEKARSLRRHGRLELLSTRAACLTERWRCRPEDAGQYCIRRDLSGGARRKHAQRAGALKPCSSDTMILPSASRAIPEGPSRPVLMSSHDAIRGIALGGGWPVDDHAVCGNYIGQVKGSRSIERHARHVAYVFRCGRCVESASRRGARPQRTRGLGRLRRCRRRSALQRRRRWLRNSRALYR
jgi:hypothetical protein